MANISCRQQGEHLLASCLAHAPWPRDLLQALVTDECSDVLFRIVAEGLSDRFDPELCEVYAGLFSEAVSAVSPGVDAAALLARYRRVRCPRPCTAEPRTVVVLSRITLGADIAVTSVLLDAAMRRFPTAEIRFAGPRKNWELFAGDARVAHVPVAYPRGGLRSRLALWPGLRSLLSEKGLIVIDPDSRLTQLGLLPVCAEENYYFFESRSYGADSDLALPELAAQWAEEMFGTMGRPWIHPAEAPGEIQRPAIAISLGVGENTAKRIPNPFEERLLRHLVETTEAVLWIDQGAGGEEAARVSQAIGRAGIPASRLRVWNGSFAGFAAIIERSNLYIGYDSAGQHAAAAAGVPLVCIFAGHPSERMFTRWRPTGSGRIQIVRAAAPVPEIVLDAVRVALGRLLRF